MTNVQPTSEPAKATPLEFDLHDNQSRWFTVQFDTLSPKRNLLMTITCGDLPIDTALLRSLNMPLYLQIKHRMLDHSNRYWAAAKETKLEPIIND